MIVLQNRQAAFDCHLLHLFSDISDIIESQEVKNAEFAIAKRFNEQSNAARAKIEQAYNNTATQRNKAYNEAYNEVTKLKQILNNPALTESQKATLEKQLTSAETALRHASESNAFMNTDSFNKLSQSQQKQVYQAMRSCIYTNI